MKERHLLARVYGLPQVSPVEHFLAPHTSREIDPVQITVRFDAEGDSIVSSLLHKVLKETKVLATGIKISKYVRFQQI